MAKDVEVVNLSGSAYSQRRHYRHVAFASVLVAIPWFHHMLGLIYVDSGIVAVGAKYRLVNLGL